jgi:hypothetical protein
MEVSVSPQSRILAMTFPGISYTDVYSYNDEMVVSNTSEEGSSSVHTGGGAIANIAVQVPGTRPITWRWGAMTRSAMRSRSMRSRTPGAQAARIALAFGNYPHVASVRR